MPLAFFRAVEETIRETLQQGIYGWQVADCTVTMTHSGYLPRQSHAHQAVNGTIPTRPRSDHNTLTREEYLLRVARRV